MGSKHRYARYLAAARSLAGACSARGSRAALSCTRAACATSALCFAWLLVGESASFAADRPPNVLMILSDDQAWTDYGFMGHPVISTPNLDRLATESLLFTRGYVPSSLCRPSLMTMMTGLYPHQHRVSGNDPPKGTDRTEMLKHVRQLPTIAKILSTRGYRCLQTGKWWEGNYKEGGFTHGMTHGDPQRRGRHGDDGLTIGRQGLRPIFDFVDQAGDQPFFIWYAPMLPHSPHTPPERLFNKYRGKVDSEHVARYYAMCDFFDETIGELMAFLDVKKLRENTLVVYVTDNGWIQNPDSPQFAPRSKRSPYEGGIRTPILFRWPGKVAPKRDDATLVSSIDLAPTILAACGLPKEDKLPGLNLLAADKTPRDILFGEIFAHDVADIDHPAASLQYRWCIQNEWKLILPHKGGGPELFQIKVDPTEQQSLAAQQPDVVKQLTAKLDAWWQPSSEPK
jgi:arylsulfatase A-like enzyme